MKCARSEHLMAGLLPGCFPPPHTWQKTTPLAGFLSSRAVLSLETAALCSATRSTALRSAAPERCAGGLQGGKLVRAERAAAPEQTTCAERVQVVGVDDAF